MSVGASCSLITCDMCPESFCCTEMSVEIDEPVDLESWDEVRWMVAHRNVSVIQEGDGTWLTVFKTPCDKLLPNGDCSIYEKRPMICKDYELETCVKNGLSAPNTLQFSTIEQVDEHIKCNNIQTLDKHTISRRESYASLDLALTATLREVGEQDVVKYVKAWIEDDVKTMRALKNYKSVQ